MPVPDLRTSAALVAHGSGPSCGAALHLCRREDPDGVMGVVGVLVGSEGHERNGTVTTKQVFRALTTLTTTSSQAAPLNTTPAARLLLPSSFSPDSGRYWRSPSGPHWLSWVPTLARGGPRGIWRSSLSVSTSLCDHLCNGAECLFCPRRWVHGGVSETECVLAWEGQPAAIGRSRPGDPDVQVRRTRPRPSTSADLREYDAQVVDPR